MSRNSEDRAASVGARDDAAAALRAFTQSGGSQPEDPRRSPPFSSLGVRGIIEEEGGPRSTAD